MECAHYPIRLRGATYSLPGLVMVYHRLVEADERRALGAVTEVGVTQPVMIEPAPYEAVVNSNALGVALISKAKDYRISFLSRHAVRRIDALGLFGRSAESLLEAPALTLADNDLFTVASLADPRNYPGAVHIHENGLDIELAISPVFDLENRYLGVMVTFRNRSDEVRQQAQAAAFQDHITQLVAEGSAQGLEAEEVGKELESIVGTVQMRGTEIRRLLDEFAGLNKQTKLLALNASIEVHRTANADAFGVVANEMRALAASMAEVASRVQEVAGRINVLSTDVQGASQAITGRIHGLVSTQRAMEATVRSNTAN